MAASKLIALIAATAVLYAAIDHPHHTAASSTPTARAKCIPPQSASPVRAVHRPASTVSAIGIAALGLSSPDIGALSAAAAVLLALHAANGDGVVGDVGFGLAAAIPAVLATTATAAGSVTTAVASFGMTYTALAVYLALGKSRAVVIVVPSLVALGLLLIRRPDSRAATPWIALLVAVAAGAVHPAVNGMSNGVCNNSLDDYRRHDLATMLSYTLGPAALVLLVGTETGSAFRMALAGSSAVVLLWVVADTYTYWLLLSMLVAGALVLGSCWDALWLPAPAQACTPVHAPKVPSRIPAVMVPVITRFVAYM